MLSFSKIPTYTRSGINIRPYCFSGIKNIQKIEEWDETLFARQGRTYIETRDLSAHWRAVCGATHIQIK